MNMHDLYLAPPISVYVVGYANGSSIVLPTDGSPLNVTCWSSGSKPSAVVTWSSKNGATLSVTSGSIQSPESAAGESVSTFDSWATVSLTSGTLSHADVLTCRASVVVLATSTDVIIRVIVPSKLHSVLTLCTGEWDTSERRRILMLDDFELCDVCGQN